MAAEDGHHHRNHAAVAGGMSWHGSKNSGYIGLDYVRRLNDRWGVGAFYEEVSGDFNLQVWGVAGKRFFDNGLKLGLGAGVERKLEKDHILALVRVDAGYDWHFGNWSIGPTGVIDFIEDGNTTYYLGAALGIGW